MKNRDTPRLLSGNFPLNNYCWINVLPVNARLESCICFSAQRWRHFTCHLLQCTDSLWSTASTSWSTITTHVSAKPNYTSWCRVPHMDKFCLSPSNFQLFSTFLLFIWIASTNTLLLWHIVDVYYLACLSTCLLLSFLLDLHVLFWFFLYFLQHHLCILPASSCHEWNNEIVSF